MDNIKNVFQVLKDNQDKLTKIGEYAYAYDSYGKMKEPIFDGYLAGIALLSSDEFDKHFMYVPTQFHDVPRKSSMESGLSTTYMDGSVSRSALPYDTAKHVFLLGPMNQTAVDYIKTLTGDVIFHVQGDASTLDRKTTSYPDAMTEHPGIFSCAFNLFTGEECSRIIRSKMNRSYTVKCKPGISLEKVDVLSNTGPMTPLTVDIPCIYVSMRKYMMTILMGGEALLPLRHMNIDAIFQDMIDKDNSVSCRMLLTHSTFPKLSLIGRRVYRSQSVPFSDYSFTAMDASGDVHFPSLKEGVTNQVFDADATRVNHKKGVDGFHALLEGLEYQYDVIADSDIVDGFGERSASERAPFHEPFIAKVKFFA
jgi:hypothetical protein